MNGVGGTDSNLRRAIARLGYGQAPLANLDTPTHWSRRKESNLFALCTRQLLFRMSYAGTAGGASAASTLVPAHALRRRIG